MRSRRWGGWGEDDFQDDDVRYDECMADQNIRYHDNENDRRRRTVISTLLSLTGLHGISTPPTGQASSDVDFVDVNYPIVAMNDVTRQIRTSVVRGAQLIDKVDGQWERFSDNLGLGRKRNLPKRNVIDVGGNVRSKEVVRSEVDAGYKLDWNDKLASSILKLCDEVSCGKLCNMLLCYLVL